LTRSSTLHVNAPLYALEDETDKKLNVDYTVTYWLENGFPASKINLGMTAIVRTQN
jgi:hypothetical protein